MIRPKKRSLALGSLSWATFGLERTSQEETAWGTHPLAKMQSWLLSFKRDSTKTLTRRIKWENRAIISGPTVSKRATRRALEEAGWVLAGCESSLAPMRKVISWGKPAIFKNLETICFSQPQFLFICKTRRCNETVHKIHLQIRYLYRHFFWAPDTFSYLLHIPYRMILRHLEPSLFQTKPSSVPPSSFTQARKPVESSSFSLPRPKQSQALLIPCPGHSHMNPALFPPGLPTTAPLHLCRKYTATAQVSSPHSLQSSLQITANDISREDLKLSFHCSFYSLYKYLLSPY